MTTKHTPGVWRPGKTGGTVVSDQPLPGYGINGGHDHVEYYGGYLIAESIWRAEDANLIAAAPDLLDAARDALETEQECGCIVPGSRRCSFCLLSAAIAKATGEQP